MMRLALAVVLVLVLSVAVGAACNKSKQDPQGAGGSGAGSGSSTPVLAKKIAVSFGVQAHGATADVFLQTTDETGRQVSHNVGTYPGQCSVITPAEDMKAVTGVRCQDGATGTELHAVVRDADIIVLKMRWDDGVTPDPMSREEVTRIQVPTGAAVEAS